MVADVFLMGKEKIKTGEEELTKPTEGGESEPDMQHQRRRIIYFYDFVLHPAPNERVRVPLRNPPRPPGCIRVWRNGDTWGSLGI